MLAAAMLPGLLIGATLGLLGGGGSVLTVPIFVWRGFAALLVVMGTVIVFENLGR